MRNYRDDRVIGTVRYSSKQIEKIAKQKKIGATLIRTGTIGLAILTVGAIAFLAGQNYNPTEEASKQNSEPNEQPTISTAEDFETTIITLDNSEPSSDKKNNFQTDHKYQPGDQINISECDFSKISVVLDAADASDSLYFELSEAHNLIESYGIDCSVTSYYDSAIDEINRIKQETGKTVFVVSVQTGQNKTDNHLVATNYKNNSDAIGDTSVEVGDKNSSDAFALAMSSCLPNCEVKKGLADDISDFHRRESALEKSIRGEGIKAITFRPSEKQSLEAGYMGPLILNTLVKASTMDNDQTYFVRANAYDGYSAPGMVRDRYGYEQVLGDSFYNDTTILSKKPPIHLSNQVNINYSNSMEGIYLDDSIEQAHNEVTTLKTH